MVGHCAAAGGRAATDQSSVDRVAHLQVAQDGGRPPRVIGPLRRPRVARERLIDHKLHRPAAALALLLQLV